MPKLQGEISDKRNALGALVEFELWPKVQDFLDDGGNSAGNEIKEKIKEFIEKYLKHFGEDEDVKKILLNVTMDKMQNLIEKYKQKDEGR